LFSPKHPQNPYERTAFDKAFKTHAICESWNSGNQPDDLLWSEPADRLLRIIGNGVVKDGYNMFMTPSQAQGKTTVVSVALYIESMSSFKAQTMDFEVDMYLALAWYDRRLAHNCTHPVLVTHKFIADRIWQPDLYFVNSKFAYLQEVTTPNVMVIVYPDGLIFKSMRLDVTLSCMMDLQRFPMDKQECPLVIQSYAYVENMVNLTWHQDPPYFPFGSNSELKINDMVITDTKFEKCLTPYIMFRGSGNWSCIRGLIVMKRLMLFHVIQTYIPTAMLVLISWMSFWLDPRASPARVTLTITTLLTLTTMSNGARQDLPQVSYIKALDIWLTFSQALIFLVLLEYSFVSYYLTKRDYNCIHRRVFGAAELYPEKEKKKSEPQSLLMTGTRRFSVNNGHANVNNFSYTAGLTRCLRNKATLFTKRQLDEQANFFNNFDISKPCQKCSASNEFIARQIDLCKYLL
uniref:Neur_chan_LBD domain-containing protein n=1 Tax=Thelazia callipaeda TaxID=103827 RepID=A0A0N5D306_THECL